ncbi:MAG TPA: D-sedoheptulose 7-phosphate isomerase [Bacteriovoracaceae bacterium]|nr:D-sedoheptulose 7-phosphate isomerase [Bacteriovoracaceae bacterium]
MTYILNSLNLAQDTLNKFVAEPKNIELIQSAINIFVESFQNNGRVFSCGNGGSMCDSLHFAEELTGRYRKDRAPLPATGISEAGHITCIANDFGFEHIFSRYVEAWGQKGDTLLAISTSGNSANVIKAVEVAKSKGMKVVGLLGKDGGKLKSMVDVPLIIDCPITDRIQEIHIKCIHIFIEGIERALFPENYLE